MLEKKYKYNSACSRNIHTNNRQTFRAHVAYCKICKEKLPSEILDSLEPQLSELIKNAHKSPRPEKQEMLPEEDLDQIVMNSVDDVMEIEKQEKQKELIGESLDKQVRNLPSIRNLAKTVKDTKRDISRLQRQMEDGFSSLDDDLKTLGESLQTLIGGRKEDENNQNVQIPPRSDNILSPQAGDKVEMPLEAVDEISQIKKETELPQTSFPPQMETPPQREEPPRREPTSQEKGDGKLPSLDTPEQIYALDEYLNQQKKKMGLDEEVEPTRGKGKIPFLPEVTEGVKGIRELIDALKGKKEEGQPLPKTTNELAMQVLLAQINKDPIDYLTKGMKYQNDSLTNAIKVVSTLLKAGKGISENDVRKIVKEESGENRREEHL